MLVNDKEIIWFEKYRPQLVEDLILPNEYISKFKKFIDKPSHILLASETPGTGKTSTMNALKKEGNFETLFINASLDRGIDLLHSKIKNFASTKSFNDKHKLIILDEFDGFSNQAADALRGTIEEFSSNCVFLITCNYISKILPAVVNRCEVYNFDDIFNYNKEELVKKIFERLNFILKNENIQYDPKDLVNVIRLFYPSVRGMIGYIQKSIFDNTLKISEQDILTSKGFDYIIEILKQRNYNRLLEEVYKIKNPTSFYSWFWKNIESIKNENKPKAIIIAAKYQAMDNEVRDKNLNLAACLTELASLI